MKKKIVIIVFIFIWFSFNILSIDFNYGGYYNNFISYIPKNNLNEKSDGFLNQKLRLNFDTQITEAVKFYFSYELLGLINRSSNFLKNVESVSYRVSDIRKRIYPHNIKEAGSFTLNQNIDRGYIKYYLPHADIYLGRQAISWGSGHIINPTDIFFSFSFADFEKEERPGVDGLRIRIPLGMMSEIDIGGVFGRDFNIDNSGYFSRFKFYIKKTDIFLILINFKNNFLYGFDITRAIGDYGFWYEMAVVENNKFTDIKPNESSYYRISTGLDYNISSKLYAIIEYHYNSCGVNDSQDYYKLLNKESYNEGSVYLLGENYFNLIMSYQLSPLISWQTTILWNINDGSTGILPSLEYNIAENIYISGGGNFYLDLYKSGVKEFDYYEDLFYTGIKMYF